MRIGVAPPTAPDTHHITLDMVGPPTLWKDALAGVDVVVNAAGALQERDMQAVHVAGSAARGPMQQCEVIGGLSRQLLGPART
jgi:hypothetical protein